MRRGSIHLFSSFSSQVDFQISSILTVLKSSRSSRDSTRGKEVHARAIRQGLISNLYIANSLITMYSSCSSISEARRVFDSIASPSIISWNALLFGYAENSLHNQAAELFYQSWLCSSPNAATLIGAIRNCVGASEKESPSRAGESLVKPKCLRELVRIHSQALKFSFHEHVFVANSLIDAYAKSGDLLGARNVFDTMKFHDVVSWTSLLIGCVDCGEFNLCLQLFNRITCIPNALTLVAACKACSGLCSRDDKPGKMKILSKTLEIQLQAEELGLDSEAILSNALIDAFGKCGSVENSKRIFDRMNNKSVISWTSLMMGYAENSDDEELALELFNRCSSVNGLSFVGALKACGNSAMIHSQTCLNKARSLHALARSSGLDEESFVSNTLIDLYSKCGRMEDSRSVFNQMKLPDVVSYNTLILGYVENGDGEEALRLFHSRSFKRDRLTYISAFKACSLLASREEATRVDGGFLKLKALEKAMAAHSLASTESLESEPLVANSLVDMYVKCGSLLDARIIFDKMKLHTLIPWTSLLLGYAQSGEKSQALGFMLCMEQQGFTPDAQTLSTSLKVAGRFCDLRTCKRIHSTVILLGLENEQVLLSCLVDSYAKCGSMVNAHQVFEAGGARADPLSRTALIAGYSFQGDSGKVFELFNELFLEEGLKPDEVTLLCVLSSCDHSGLVEKGKACFQAMFSRFGVTLVAQHYCCLVDLLGRANRVDEAVQMANSVELGRDAKELMWKSVLGACVKWKNVVSGKLAFEALIGLRGDREDVAYTLMGNLYASAGLWEEQAKVEAMRRSFSKL